MLLITLVNAILSITYVASSSRSVSGRQPNNLKLYQGFFDGVASQSIDTLYLSRARRSTVEMEMLESVGLNTNKDTIVISGDADADDHSLVKFSLPSEVLDLSISKAKLYLRFPKLVRGVRHARMSLKIQLVDDIKNVNVTVIKRIPRHFSDKQWYSVKTMSAPLAELIDKYRRKPVSVNIHVSCPTCGYKSSRMNQWVHTKIVLQGSKQHLVSDRSVNTPTCVGKCCLKSLVVDFDKLGYDWILYPKRYVANYCEGSCSRRYLSAYDVQQLPTNTRVLQAMLKLQQIDADGASCAPKDTSPVRIIYRDANGAIRTDTSTLRTIHSCQCT